MSTDGLAYHAPKDWLRVAFIEWLAVRLYLDNAGNYRSKVPGYPRRIVPYNQALKRAYPQNRDFRLAAHRWGTRITPSDPPSIRALLQRREADVRAGRLLDTL